MVIRGHAIERHWAELAGFVGSGDRAGETSNLADKVPCALGLYAYQEEAAAVLAARLRRWRCAVLADPVGSGKSYTALGTATLVGGSVTVVCPAPLVPQWRSLLKESGLAGEVISDGLLSRRRVVSRQSGLVIVDEAHRFRSLSTQRRASLVGLVLYRPILWISATPVWNSRRDILALVSITVGPALFEDAVGIDYSAAWKHIDERDDVWNCVCERYVFRRMRPACNRRSYIEARPEVVSADLCKRVSKIAPAGMVFDGEPCELFRRAVARALSSSAEAAEGMLNRARLFLVRLDEAQRTGGTLSRREFLSAFGLDALAAQCIMPFWFLPGSNPIVGLDRIINELSEVVTALQGESFASSEKLSVLIEALRPSNGSLVFTEYQATAAAIVDSLPEEFRPALLTGSRCRIRGVGNLHRSALLQAFVFGDDALSRPVRTLVLTPLGAEGLNLQRADTVVHADLPWSHARLEQRVGRADRIGGHRTVRVVTFLPPRLLETICGVEIILDRKADLTPIRESPVPGRVAGRVGRSLQPCTVRTFDDTVVELSARRIVVRRGERLVPPSELVSRLGGSAYDAFPFTLRPLEPQRVPSRELSGRTSALLRAGRYDDAAHWVELLDVVFTEAGEGGEAALEDGIVPDGP